LEGWVVAEAAKALMALGRKPDIYFWRSHDGLEVDLLIALGGALVPIEVKRTATPGLGHVAALDRLIAAAGGDAAPAGLLVGRSAERRTLPRGGMRRRLGGNFRGGWRSA
jgi:hypothetical protein